MKTDQKKGRAKENKAMKDKTKPSKTYAWISLVLVLFFWVPLLNILFFLPASAYFGIRAILASRRNPEKYGGFLIAVFSVSVAFVSFIFAVIVLLMDMSGKV